MNRFALATLVAFAAGSVAHAQVIGTPVFLGQTTFPTSFQFGGTTVGGLSGIAYDPATGGYLSVS